MKGIKDRIAVITGGASGIGAGLVQAFAAAGAKVAFADIQKEAGEAIANQIGSQCLFIPADLRRDADIDRIVESATSLFGGIDFLINAAATYADKGLRFRPGDVAERIRYQLVRSRHAGKARA